MRVKQFRGGQLASYVSFWETLTSDPEILQTVSGASIDFDTTPPCRHSTKPLLLKGDDFDMLHSEIQQLIAKGVVVPCCHDTVEYFSPIFPVFNTDESVRMILNLKDLNHFIKYLHFKMDSIHSVLHSVLWTLLTLKVLIILFQ